MRSPPTSGALITNLGGRSDTLLAARSLGVIMRTTDGGATWTHVFGSFDTSQVVNIEPEAFFLFPTGHPRARRILAGAGDTSGISYSDDRGATWRLPDLSAFPIAPGNFVDFGAYLFRLLPSGRLLAGGEWGVATSDDDGSSWAPTPLFGPFRYEVRAMAALATPGSTQTGQPACGLPDAARCDGAIALGIDATLPEVQAWRTSDGGRTWSAPVALPQPQDGLGYGHAAGVIPLGTGPNGLGRAVAVLGRGLIYATRDGGQSWTAVGRLPITLDYNWAYYARLGPDGHVWVGTMHGWMYRSAEPASSAFAVAGEAGPSEAQGLGVTVRPNPAGGRVEVVLTLTEASSVRAVVVDALGREVAVVLDGPVAVGERVVGVDTAAWPAGVYVVRVTADAQTVAARLVVAR